jgi:hypothetical protein
VSSLVRGCSATVDVIDEPGEKLILDIPAKEKYDGESTCIVRVEHLKMVKKKETTSEKILYLAPAGQPRCYEGRPCVSCGGGHQLGRVEPQRSPTDVDARQRSSGTQTDRSTVYAKPEYCRIHLTSPLRGW